MAASGGPKRGLGRGLGEAVGQGLGALIPDTPLDRDGAAGALDDAGAGAPLEV